jgi:EmrB/QacA subfamily drug resistance transporter
MTAPAATSPATGGPAAPRPTGRDGHRWVILVLVCAAQFMVILDATVVNVALPSIRNGLHFSTGDLQWVVNAYALVFGGFLLLGGRAADLIGRQRLFLAGIAVFSAASLLDGLSGTSGMLVGSRALQGLGGALVSPAALSIITTSFPEGPHRTRALGVWSAIAASGAAFGLLAGGILTDLASWRWVFFVNVPIGLAVLLLSARLVPDTRLEDARGGIDLAGAVTVTGGLVALVDAIVEAQSAGWLAPRTLVTAGVSLTLLAAFVGIERRVDHPLVRLGVFRRRSLLGADLALLLAAGGLSAVFFLTSLYLQGSLALSPLRTGVAFLPVTLGIMAGAGTAQVVLRHAGVREVAITGQLVAAAGLLLLTRITAHGGYATELLPGLVVTAVGIGVTFVPVTLMATTGVATAEAGLASGLLTTAQQIGGALGLAILSTLASDRATGALRGLRHLPTLADQAMALVGGFRTAFVGAAIMMAVGAAILAAAVRRRHVIGVELHAARVVADAA